MMVWRFLKKLGIKPLCDPEIPLLGIYPEETKIVEDTCIPMFTAPQFTIARPQKQPKYPLILRSCGTYIQWNIEFSSVQSLSHV